MPKKAKTDSDQPRAQTLYTIKLNDEQLDKLGDVLEDKAFAAAYVDHSLFAYKGELEKVNVVAYKSGKVVIQGRGTEAFVRDILEPMVTGVAQLGYDEVHHPEWFEPHAGLDEAGKGDVFGPLVSCCVIADGDMVRAWREQGVADSKTRTDAAILTLEKVILKTKGVVVTKRFASMERYNEMMARPAANLNKLLAWYHARALQEALDQRQVAWGLLDQFSKAPLTQRQMQKDGWEFDLRMRTKAESDPVVAAASICARAEFLRQMDRLSKEWGAPLLKGASAQVKQQAKEIVTKLGDEALGRFAKLHFKTCYEARGLPVPEKPGNWR